MVFPPSVHTGHVSHPTAPIVQGNSGNGVHQKPITEETTTSNTTGEDNLVIQGNAAGSPVKDILDSKIDFTEKA